MAAVADMAMPWRGVLLAPPPNISHGCWQADTFYGRAGCSSSVIRRTLVMSRRPPAMNDSRIKQAFLEQRAALARYLRARSLSQDDAEDIVQDLYLKLDSYDGGPIGEPRAYLYRMAHNLLLDRRRSAMRRVRREEQWSGSDLGLTADIDDAPGADQIIAARQQLTAVTGAINRLPERTRDIFRRFRLDEQTQQAIADEIGISKSAVEKHIYRAYRAIHAARNDHDAPLDATCHDPQRLADMGSTDHD